jgi:NAD+ synthetase
MFMSCETLNTLVSYFRDCRGFDVEHYISAKIALLRHYFFNMRIDTCIVGVSGGVDSAVVLGLLQGVLKLPNSPLQRVIPVLLPMHCVGATQQTMATQRGEAVASHFHLTESTIDLSDIHRILSHTVDVQVGIHANAWAAGQLVSYLRTPVLYYYAALLQQEGMKSIVCGTTNRDEGAYLGFFGKASDGMVDLQVISDIHKSEVYQIARKLSVPSCILNASPSGDTYDGKTDEEMLGVSYDFVELYLHWLNLPCPKNKNNILASLSDLAKKEFERGAACIEKRHQTNFHKYFDGTPALHMDVYQRAVIGGWQIRNTTTTQQINADQFVGYCTLNLDDVYVHIASAPQPPDMTALPGFQTSAYQLTHLLPQSAITLLCEQFLKQRWVPANQFGYPLHENPRYASASSYRATIYDPSLADALYQRILLTSFPRLKSVNAYSSAETVSHPYWRLVGVNPTFRFIKYDKEGYLLPHYDAGYDFQDNQRHTLMSMLIYLTDSADEGGLTRFLWDKQRYLPTSERDFRDHPTKSLSTDSLSDLFPQAGSALIFDHRLLHEATSWEADTSRLVLRTDLIFEKCGVDFTLPSLSNSLQQRLLEQLGLETWQNSQQIDRTYQACLMGDHTETQHFAWQVLRDPFLATASRTFTCFEQLDEAGFFADQRSLEDMQYADLSWMVTPLHKIKKCLEQLEGKTQRSYVVLLTTGAFGPMHQGHLDMMECAKRYLEAQGKCILGGYISPDHKNYLEVKNINFPSTDAERLAHCERFVETSPWLMIDPWQMQYQRTQVNLTCVVERISAYLAAHIKSACPIEVIYVCGGDNARFTLNFSARGQCIIVPREGYEKNVACYKAHDSIKGNPRIYFCNDYASTMSSTQLREKKLIPHAPAISHEQSKGMFLHIRDEDDWPLQHWKDHKNFTEIKTAYEIFKTSVMDELQNIYPGKVTITRSYLKTQQQVIKEKRSRHLLLSLDPCIEGDYNIAISRYFFSAYSTGETYTFGPRPGSAPLSEQLLNIPKGKYILTDDDIFSGQTIQQVLKLLPAHCDIIEIFSFFKSHSPERIEEDTEVCDLRDFLVGGHCAGLSLLLPNNDVASAPYIMPHVRPHYRLSIPIAQERLFSLKIWKLNVKFFQSIQPSLTLADAAFSFQKLAYYTGFSSQTTLEDFCQWHITQLAYGG